MKKLWIKKIRAWLLLLMISFCFSLHATKASEGILLEQATSAFEKKDYDHAYALYEKIENKSSFILYQLGVCANKQGKIGYALLFFRRAEKDWGLFNRTVLRQEIENIKQTVDANLGDKKPRASYIQAALMPLKALRDPLLEGAKSIPLIYLQLLVLFLWVLLFMYLRRLIKKRKKFLWVSLFILQFCAAAGLAFKYSLMHKNCLVVLKNNVPLYSGPGSDFAMLSHLQEAQEADILNSSDGYYKIRTAYAIGWVEQSNVEKV